jgi:hypothetical protein
VEVQFQLTLYLPFLLPRDSRDWGSDPIDYSRGDLRIRIVVLRQELAKDAPVGVDDLVATPQGTEPEFTIWQITSTPHKKFYDAIVVLVVGSVEKNEDLVKPVVRARFLNAAIGAARRFLNFCRALARDTEIYFNAPEVVPEYVRFAGFPHCQGWFDPYSGAALGDASTNFCSGEFVAGRSGINSIRWEALREAVQSSGQPPVEVLSLLDATIASANFDDRKAVLLAAISVEVAVKSFLQKTNFDKDQLKKLEDSLEIRFWEKYFDLLLPLAGQPSLKTAAPDLYKQIEVLFRVRNKIAHEGICYLEKDGKGHPMPLKHREIGSLVSAAGHVVDWLDSLKIA